MSGRVKKIFSRSSARDPEGLVKKCGHALDDFEDEDGAVNIKANESISKRLRDMRTILYGEGNEHDSEPQPEMCNILADWLMKENLMLRLLPYLKQLEFEARKHFSQVFNNLMRKNWNNFSGYIQVILVQFFSDRSLI